MPYHTLNLSKAMLHNTVTYTPSDKTGGGGFAVASSIRPPPLGGQGVLDESVPTKSLPKALPPKSKPKSLPKAVLLL